MSDETFDLSIMPNMSNDGVNLVLCITPSNDTSVTVDPGETLLLTLGEADEVLVDMFQRLMASAQSIRVIKDAIEEHQMGADTAIEQHRQRISSGMN